MIKTRAIQGREKYFIKNNKTIITNMFMEIRYYIHEARTAAIKGVIRKQESSKIKNQVAKTKN